MSVAPHRHRVGKPATWWRNPPRCSLWSVTTRPATIATRDAMLDAARELIAEIGYASMSHADITAAVGMGRTTFYEHFSSKEDLLIELVRRDLPPLTVEILSLIHISEPTRR